MDFIRSWCSWGRAAFQFCQLALSSWNHGETDRIIGWTHSLQSFCVFAQFLRGCSLFQRLFFDWEKSAAVKFTKKQRWESLRTLHPKDQWEFMVFPATSQSDSWGRHLGSKQLRNLTETRWPGFHRKNVRSMENVWKVRFYNLFWFHIFLLAGELPNFFLKVIICYHSIQVKMLVASKPAFNFSIARFGWYRHKFRCKLLSVSHMQKIITQSGRGVPHKADLPSGFITSYTSALWHTSDGGSRSPKHRTIPVSPVSEVPAPCSGGPRS